MRSSRSQFRFRASLAGLVVAAAAVTAPAEAALPIPLTVQETLLPGIAGMARSSGPVSVGVPLESNSGITDVSQLGMSGATAAQFRVLARWPNGAIRWVLADFQADVSAGGTASGVSLTTGTGSFGGGNLATDNGTTIQVSTGTASFTIRKSPFRVFDQVSVGATNIVSAGGEGFVVVDASGTRYTSANDPGATVVVEENGPVRSVIRAMGTLRSSTGARLCEYLVRLHFYRGKSYVRAWASMKNAKGGGPATTFLFNSAEIVVPLALGTGPRFQTSTSRGAVNDALASGETAYVFQARSSLYDWVENSYAESPISTTQNGVEVRKVGGTVYQALSGNVADFADGWASLEDGSGKGVTIALRWMPQFGPAGLEVGADGHASVELFSKRNAKTGIKFAWGAYETREMMFNFYATPPANRSAAMYELQYPLAARAPLAQYASGGAIFGETKLASVSEQQSWFSRHGASSPAIANITPSF